MELLQVQVVILILIDPPIVPMKIYKLPFKYGEDIPLLIFYAQQHLRKEKLAWPDTLTGLMLQRRCTFYFLTSLEARCLPIMATTLKWIWIQ